MGCFTSNCSCPYRSTWCSVPTQRSIILVYESLSPFRGVPIYSSSLHRLPIREFQVLVRVGDSFRWQTSHFVGRCRPESIRAWSCLQSANRSGVPFFVVPIAITSFNWANSVRADLSASWAGWTIDGLFLVVDGIHPCLTSAFRC